MRKSYEDWIEVESDGTTIHLTTMGEAAERPNACGA